MFFGRLVLITNKVRFDLTIAKANETKWWQLARSKPRRTNKQLLSIQQQHRSNRTHLKARSATCCSWLLAKTRAWTWQPAKLSASRLTVFDPTTSNWLTVLSGKAKTMRKGLRVNGYFVSCCSIKKKTFLKRRNKIKQVKIITKKKINVKQLCFSAFFALALLV